MNTLLCPNRISADNAQIPPDPPANYVIVTESDYTQNNPNQHLQIGGGINKPLSAQNLMIILLVILGIALLYGDIL